MGISPGRCKPLGDPSLGGRAVVLALGSEVRWPAESGLEPGPRVVGLSRLDELTRFRLHHKKVAFLLDLDELGPGRAPLRQGP